MAGHASDMVNGRIQPEYSTNGNTGDRYPIFGELDSLYSSGRRRHSVFEESADAKKSRLFRPASMSSESSEAVHVHHI